MSAIERQDRLGTLLLMVLLTLVMGGVWWAIERNAPPPSSPSEAQHTTDKAKPTNAPRTWRLRPFDPNTASEATLRDIGFSEFHIRNLMRYRSKGGHWRSVEHFQQLYGLSPEDFALLRPYVQLSAMATRTQPTKRPNDAPFAPRYETIDKLQVGEQLDLVTADTAALKRIPGVGSVFARRIVAHRTALGGFTSVEQLREIPDLPAEVLAYCHLSTTAVQPLNANTASYAQLIRHPYLNAAQVRAITTYREQFGRFRSLQQLLNLLPATDADRNRLRPYLTCL